MVTRANANSSVVADSETRAGGAGGRVADRYTVYNQDMWKNVLGLGLQDLRVMSVVQIVWNVTADLCKILARQRERQDKQLRRGGEKLGVDSLVRSASFPGAQSYITF